MMLQKDKKREKSAWRFTLDPTHPLEGGFLILEILHIFLLEKVKVNGKARNLGNVHIECFKNKMIFPEKQFSKSYLKYRTKRYLKKNSLHGWLYVVVSDSETYELYYFKISQDEGGFESED